ncbi:BTB/POZ domain-containing protein At5g47800-like [Cynara cardunculus var. scolymus]|uniref:BTB/POZ domain-containing protein At5g47800-like n=1 Tax=Cynara cardunculus var. scolymus TaxID=59895 RepID=UPI000D626E4A|nr:BTB/POZ domain-containing protein At5g47800-like [Cynara cardunculus var. scolymus]
MKFMRLGTRPDTFYTGEATRMMISDLPSDLTIRINNITYLLHKFPLLPKCGLLQLLCSGRGHAGSVTLDLHDIPGGEDAFELCAKFCYGIKIDLSAHNFVPAICAAMFLRMIETVGDGNFVSKLEVFFNSCILEGWKDSIVALQTTERFPEWSESLGIIRRCIDSVVDKILTPPPKVRWSYTYTRPGYAQKKHHKSAPKDWWTEDIADLNVDLFRCVVNTVRSTNMLLPQLVGEALHVYACRWLPDFTRGRPDPETSTASQLTQEKLVNGKKQLEMIVILIPEDRGSVSVGFLLRLLSMANLLRVSPAINMQLIKKCSLQLEEATLNDLMLPSHDSCADHHIYDIELVGSVLEGFITQWRKSYSRDEYLLRKVGEIIDSYLQVVSMDANMPVQKVVSLANVLPEFARPEHDILYKTIDIYLNEHPQMSKEEKKHLCSILDCHKLSAEACAHAVKNEKLPLRIVVQVLFFEHEKHGRKSTRSHEKQQPEIQPQGIEQTETTVCSLERSQLFSGERSSKQEDAKRRSAPSSTLQKLEPESEQKSRWKKVGEMGSDDGDERGIMEERSIQDLTKIRMRRSKSEHGRRKGK